MLLTNEGEQESMNVMLNNVQLIEGSAYLSQDGIVKIPSQDDIAQILHSSFWNHLLRFIVINGKKYTTNSKLHIRGGLFLDYTNPHEENIRVSYNVDKQILFVEKMELVPHPFLSMQRIDSHANELIMLRGYEASGYTNPNAKVQEWHKVGDEIPISKIYSIRLETFWDRPKCIWNDRDNYTAYTMVIKTRLDKVIKERGKKARRKK